MYVCMYVFVWILFYVFMSSILLAFFSSVACVALIMQGGERDLSLIDF